MLNMQQVETMGFFSSIGQVVTNNKTFKNWEEEQKDNDARRKALAQNNPKTTQELEAAKKQGQVIIDIIDIMDTHSEDVAEKTETVTTPIQGLIPYATTLLSSFAGFKFIVEPAAKALNKVRSEFLENEEVKKIVETINNYENKNNIPDLKWFDGYKLFNKESMEKLKNIDDKEVKNAYKRACELVAEYKNNPTVKNYGKKWGLSIIIPLVAGVASFVASTILATKLQVNSSRIARWQSREQLKNPKYFVQYTPEQIEQAKQIVETKEQEEKGFSSKLFKNKEKSSLIQVIKDNKKYKEWKKTDKDESKLINRELTQEELTEAQKDKEVIQRITKIINNKAEDYSENMEVAADTLIMGTPFLGGAIGAIVSFIGNKTGILDKVAHNNIEKFIKGLDKSSAQSVKEAYEALKGVSKDNPKFKELSQKLTKSILFADYKVKTGTSLDNIIGMAKKGLSLGLTTNSGRNKAFAIIGGIITTTVGLILGLKLQKASARAGRFLAKRELEKDPNNFIGYTDEELKSVEDVKAQKEPFGKKFKEYITFLPRVIGEYFEYKKYKRTTAAKNKAIKEELVKMQVDEKQLKDAKNLQNKMFNTFEKVDDKSQEYSESIEAVTEIAKPLVFSLGILGAISPAIVVGIQVIRGKIKAVNLIEKATKFLSEKTGFLKGKTVKKYLNDVNKNLFFVSEDIISKGIKNADDMPIEPEDIKSFMSDGFKNILKLIKENITKMDEKDFKKFAGSQNIPSWLKNILQNANRKQCISILENLEKIEKNIPEKSINEIFETYLKLVISDPEKAKELIRNTDTLKKILITKDVKKYGAIAAGTWTSLSFVLTFMLESCLAKLQKESGRLGVMKAIEELDDPRYYANFETTQANKNYKSADEVKIKDNKYLL